MKPALSRTHGWLVAIMATSAMSVSYIDRQTLAALAPTVRTALSIDRTHYGWLTSAFSMAYLVAAPLAGTLVDRAGARRGLAAAVLVWSGVAVLHAAAPTFAMLFALRIALGLAEAPSFPGAVQAVKRSLPEGDRSAGVGLLFTGSSVGAMIAAPVAVALNKHFGWRFAFVGTALIGLLWIPCWLLATRGAKAQLAPRPDERTPTKFFHEAAATLAELGRQGAVIRAVLLVVASAPGIMFVLNWFPQYLADAHGIVQDDLGHYAWCPPLFFDVGAVAFGVAASRRERNGAARAHSDLVAFAAMLAATLGCLSLAESAFEATLVASVSMAGGGALFALLTGDMLSRIEPSRVSRAGGLTAAAQSLAYVIASPIVGTVVDRTHTYDRVLLGIAALVVPGAAAWIAWPGIAPRQKD